MSTFDTPSINVSTKSNEQNLQITKSYLANLASELNYELSVITARLEELEERITTLEGEE